MDEINQRYQYARAKHCDNCLAQRYCYTPCPLVQSYAFGLPCTKELERLKGDQQMTALEYMEKQIQKHRQNFQRELFRGVPDEQLNNIALKIFYYESAAEALRKVGDGNA